MLTGARNVLEKAFLCRGGDGHLCTWCRETQIRTFTNPHHFAQAHKRTYAHAYVDRHRQTDRDRQRQTQTQTKTETQTQTQTQTNRQTDM